LVALSTKTVKVYAKFSLIEVAFLLLSALLLRHQAMILHLRKSVSLRKETKSLNRFFNPDGLCFLKSDIGS
jgi:hypothetical protein